MIVVEWEKPAQDRHEAWALGIALEFSITHMQTYLAEIQSAEQKISNYPNIGTNFQSPRGMIKRFVTASGYSVYYILDNLIDPTRALIVSIVRGQAEL